MTAFRLYGLRLAGAFALALLLPLAQPAAAQDLTDMNDAERAAFRAEVRAYLMENPEVLMEAIGVLEQRQAAAQTADDRTLVAANAADLFESADSWVGGNPDGDVTIVEFTDYRCGYCRKAFPEVEKLVTEDGNIRLILKEFPILGEQSVFSSRAAIATRLAFGDDAYKSMHDALITLRGNADTNAIRAIAGDLGLDADTIIDGMNAPEVDAVIGQNHALGQRLQISGTPTFVVGDDMLRGYMPLAGMQDLVASLRQGG
ncbi:DsbA family protein [Tropicimonas sp. IMCC34043]|uniref:DsbA family protein n=1 Tax=Tropicimonas sp. IMCC34043 TaxID=2248760 RepID=UPI000E227CF3|nr:DsbA family protein [Tropicimonas sp. IMCC34043]